MIFTLILNIVYVAVLTAFSPLLALPIATLPSGFSESIQNMAAVLASFNQFVPVDSLLNVFAYTVSFEAGYFLFKTIMWIVRRLPTQS